jgi:pyruvate formate lyase activating enzyme
MTMDEVKGLLFDIKRFAMHDGPGIRTTVFFKGCPLTCWWCQNPESRASHVETQPPLAIRKNHDLFSCGSQLGDWFSVADILQVVRRDRSFFQESNGGMSVSGGEPLAQSAFLVALLAAAQSEHLHTVVDTTGLAEREDLLATAAHCDLFLYDLKLIDPIAHRQHTGVDNQLILDNFRLLIDQKKMLWVRIPLIPGVTDSEENLKGLAAFLRQSDFHGRVDLLPYNILAEEKYKRLQLPGLTPKLARQSDAFINRWRDYFRRQGFQCGEEK